MPATVPAGTYSVTVANSSGRSGTKNAALQLTAPAGSSGTDSGSSGAPTVTEKADLAVSISSFPTTARVGDLLTYTIGVTGKNGAAASGLVLHVDLPAAVSLVSAYADHGSGTCSGASTLTCALGALPGSQTATTRITARVLRAGSLEATATVTYDGSEGSHSATVSPSVSGSIAAPSMRFGGSAATSSRHGKSALVSSTVRFNQPASVTISVVAGKSQHAVSLLAGSRVGSAQFGHARTSITLPVTAGESLALRLRVPVSALGSSTYVKVVAKGYGGTTANKLRVR